MKVGEIVSRIRNTVKASKEDAFLTDRYLWSLVNKHSRPLLSSALFSSDFYEHYIVLPCIPLIPTDKVAACCAGIKSNCTIMRTKDPLPDIFNGPHGPLLRTVSSVDGSSILQRTSPETYTSMTKTTAFKYNQNNYYWYLDNHLYLPEISWELLKVEGMFSDSIAAYQCDPDKQCTIRQDEESTLPDDFLADIEMRVLQELGIAVQLPGDLKDDKQNIFR